MINYKKLKTSPWLTAIFATFLLLGASPASAMTPNTTQEAKPNKKYVIGYKDYNNILAGLVLPKGPSSRVPPPKAKPPVGTKISFVNKKKTRLEANRVLFHILKDEDIDVIRQIRLSLESIPDQIPLDNFSKDEQLAYWLNLRNVAVIEVVAEAYPRMRLKRFWSKQKNKKMLTVSGQSLSIKDIETHVITNWPRAQVIYGFFNGTIGGPNIRDRAYTGKNVWGNLSKNSREFVNSLRGIQFYKRTTKLSDFYERYPTLFPDFKTDLKKHIRANLKPDLVMKMDKTTKLSLSINDWSIADLMNGRLGLSSAGSIGPAGLVLAMIHGQNSRSMLNNMMSKEMPYLSLQKYPEHVQKYIMDMKKMREDSTGNVTIENVEGNEKDVSTKNKKAKNN